MFAPENRFPSQPDLDESYYPDVTEPLRNIRQDIITDLLKTRGQYGEDAVQEKLYKQFQRQGCWDITERPDFPSCFDKGTAQYAKLGRGAASGEFIKHHLFGNVLAAMGYDVPDTNNQSSKNKFPTHLIPEHLNNPNLLQTGTDAWKNGDNATWSYSAYDNETPLQSKNTPLNNPMAQSSKSPLAKALRQVDNNIFPTATPPLIAEGRPYMIDKDSTTSGPPMRFGPDLNLLPPDVPGHSSIRGRANRMINNPLEFEVAAHGTERRILDQNKQDMSVDQLVQMIHKHPDYKKGQPIRLYSCNTGNTKRTPNPIAQDIADIEDGVVRAPSDYVWFGDSRYPEVRGKFTIPRTKWDFKTNYGDFNEFNSRKKHQ